MFKQIIFISMVLVALSSAQMCRDFTCVGELQPCNRDTYGYPARSSLVGDSGIPATTTATCQVGFFCGVNPNYLPEGNGLNPPNLCFPIGHIGDTCENDRQCLQGLVCYGLNNGPSVSDLQAAAPPATCQNLNFAALGEDCRSDAECISAGEYLKCSLDGECVANLQGDSEDYFYYDCQTDLQCPPSQYCNSSTSAYSNCLPRATLGATCAGVDNIVCESNLMCDVSEDGISYTCITPFSEVENAKCSAENHLSSIPPLSPCDIASRLTCSGGVCAKIPDATPAATNCSSEVSGCSGYSEQCSCTADQYTGQCVASIPTDITACKTASLAYVNCVQKEGCQADLHKYNDGSCAMDQCKSEYCNAISECTPVSGPTSCFTESHSVKDFAVCGKLSSSSSVRPVIVASFILAIFAALL
eukprot:gene15035-17786_t